MTAAVYGCVLSYENDLKAFLSQRADVNNADSRPTLDLSTNIYIYVLMWGNGASHMGKNRYLIFPNGHGIKF